MIYTQTARAVADFAAEICTGLRKPGQKELPSKYFYDAVGFALFEVICVLPEYGLARADERLLRRHAHEIVDGLPMPLIVAELGSGSGNKTRWLIEALRWRQPTTTYHPIEISPSALQRCERELGCIDSISVVGFERSYLDGLLEVAARRQSGQHLLVLFLGGNIGNFDRAAGVQFLREVRRTLISGDALLLGADLEKPVRQLILAYDDPIGVTAAFNLNLLARINRELDSNFILSQFQHLARYDQQERRIEMHLRSTVDQMVTIGKADFTVRLRKDETIWTENSHRYNCREIVSMAEQTGFQCKTQWVDQEWPFAESLFVAE